MRIHFLLPLVLGLHAIQARAAVARFPAGLSVQDRNLVIKAACPAGADRLSAVTRERGARLVEVDVQCTPSRLEGSLPVAHHTTCSNGKGAWHCQEGYDAVQMPMPDSSVVAVTPRGMDFRTAIELVTGALTTTVPPFHDSPRKFLAGSCQVLRRKAVYSEEFQRYSIECSSGGMFVTRVCPGGHCSYFSEGGWQGPRGTAE